MKHVRIMRSLFIVLFVAGACRVAAAQESRPAAGQEGLPVAPAGTVVAAAGAAVTIDEKTGNVVSIRLRDVEEMARPHPVGGETPFGYVEVVDLHDHRTYNPLVARGVQSGWAVTGAGDATKLTFTQQYDGAPFRVVQTFRATPVGVRWEAALALLDGEKANRSVQVNWVLPLPTTWQFWGPNRTEASRTNGVMPYRFVYGHSDPGPTEIVIPLVGVWGRRAGAAVFSPPDVRKCQISFDVYTQNCIDAAAGVSRRVEDLQCLRVAHYMVGLRPGKELRLAVCLAGTRGDWRGVLGHYVTNYAEYFEPMPEVRKYEGLYAITTPNAWLGKDVRRPRPGGPGSQPSADRRGGPDTQSQPAAQTQAGATSRRGADAASSTAPPRGPGGGGDHVRRGTRPLPGVRLLHQR